jgi:hypothetical protein
MAAVSVGSPQNVSPAIAHAEAGGDRVLSPVLRLALRLVAAVVAAAPSRQDRRIRPLCHPSEAIMMRVFAATRLSRQRFCSRSCSNARQGITLRGPEGQTSQHYGAPGHRGPFGHGLPELSVTSTKTNVSTAGRPGAGATGQMRGLFHWLPLTE